MSNTWGRKIRISIFGESHGECVGILIDGIKPGIKINIEKLQKEMDRRRPGKSSITTQRAEADKVIIKSGIFNEQTTGAPIMMIIENKDKISKDYESLKFTPRPGHSDMPAFFRFDGKNDYRGGGHFSGRITATLVMAGALSKQILEEKGIDIASHITRIGSLTDKKFSVDSSFEDIKNSSKREIAVLDDDKETQMKSLIENAKKQGDSLGGEIECIIRGIQKGIGEPFFDSVESSISHLAFSIPGVKGIEFGDGFEFSQKTGTESVDEYYMENNEIKMFTNHNGGITGGLTNGEDIVFRLAVKPTPSISKELRTVNLKTKKNDIVYTKGRHDPCIAIRMPAIAEAIAAISILDFLN